MIRRHSGSASEPSARVGSPSSATRSMPSGWRSVKLRSRPTTMPAGLVAGGRSTGTSRPRVVEVVLDERAGGLAGAAARRRAGASSLTISAGCSSAAPARRDDPLRALVQRPQRLASAARRPRRRRPARPARTGAARARARCRRARAAGPGRAPSRRPGRPSTGAMRTHDRADLRRRQVDRRPDVQEDAVPLQPAARLAVGLEAADSLERLRRASARARAARPRARRRRAAA